MERLRLGGKVRKIEIPIDITQEDMQNLFRTVYRMPDYIITDEEYQAFVNSNDEGRMIFLNPIIGHWLEKYKSDSKKKKELYDLASYIYTTGKDIKVLVVDESPDFVISVEGEAIGVEHTTLYTKAVAPLNVMKGILEDARKILLDKHPAFTGLFNIFIVTENVKVNNRRNDAIAIAGYLEGLLMQKDAPRPDFIDEAITTPHNTGIGFIGRL